MVCSSNKESQNKKLKAINLATRKTARLLNMSFESRQINENFSKVFVYYDNGTDEPIPIYCDKGKKERIQDICTILRKMMFVLSFHPKNFSLKYIRNSIMTLS